MTLINSDQNLSPLQKFNYIQVSLKNNTAWVVDSLVITGANYLLALMIFKDFINLSKLSNNLLKVGIANVFISLQKN